MTWFLELIRLLRELNSKPHWSADDWRLAIPVATAACATLFFIARLFRKLGGQALSKFRTVRDRRTLEGRLVGAERYDRGEIARATRFYVEPDSQSVDPAGEEDIRHVIAVRAPLFETIDKLIAHSPRYRFVIVLADSGMGKTSFLLNYYARYWRSRSQCRFNLVLIPLNLPSADAAIQNIPEEERGETVLFLDALDEDRRAIEDHRERVQKLIGLATGFKLVLITCRTQFFPRDEEIPDETGVLRLGPTRPNEARGLEFHRLYLSPFNDAQVERYLKLRFPLRRRRRKAARGIVLKIHDLVARPMLLAHIDDLLETGKNIEYGFEAYESMVNAWLEREKGLVKSKTALREFSELLAVDIFVNRAKRRMERIPGSELEPLAKQFNIPLQAWELRGRSLLNRDAVGNYKFAHRSIMEYLFATGFLKGKVPKHTEPWTAQIKAFVVEQLRSLSPKHYSPGSDSYVAHIRPFVLPRPSDLSGADFCGVDLSELDLAGANLSRARLRDSNLERTNLQSAKLVEADLTSARLGETSFRYADFNGACLEGVSVGRTRLHGADLSTATGLTDALLSRCLGDDRTRLPEGFKTPQAWLPPPPSYEHPNPSDDSDSRFDDMERGD